MLQARMPWSSGHSANDVRVLCLSAHALCLALAVQADELGPRSAVEGPCLVLFRGVTTPPPALNAWLVNSMFLHSIQRTYWFDPAVPPCATL